MTSSLDAQLTADGGALNRRRSDVTRYLGHGFLFCYRGWERVRSKYFSILAAGAFAHFGKKTVLACPVRLAGEQRISIGDRVFIGPGSWLQTLQDCGNEAVAISIGS